MSDRAKADPTFVEPGAAVFPGAQSSLDALPDFLIWVAADGSVAWTNRAFARVLGDPVTRLVGQSLFELIETPSERAKSYLRRCTGSRQPLPGSLVFRRNEGGQLECRCDGAVLAAEDGLPSSIVLMRCRPARQAGSQFILLNNQISKLTREVVGRRRVEDELRRLNDTLEQRVAERAQEIAAAQIRLNQSEENFRRLVQGVTDYAIFTLDRRGYVMTWNPGAERIKGYAAAEIIGQHFSRFYTEQDREAHVPQGALMIAARTGKFEAEGWRVRKDGSQFWANVVIDAIRDDTGEVVRFAKVTRDLTEKRAAEEQLRQAQKMEAIGQLTGGVAHDFNNILTVISGNIETMQRHLSANDQRLHRLAVTAMRGVERATILTHRLLAFSRRQPLDPKPLDVNRLIIGMSDLLARTIGEHIRVETVLSAGLWQVSVDPNQLENAVLNLAVNARDAILGPGKLTIETANTYLDEDYAAAHEEVRAGQYVMLAVSDTGQGMPPDVMSKAFEPFFTTKRLGEGTGLGLSQVYGFVKQSGGHIKIYSEPGEGTTVRLYFRRVTASGASEEQAHRAAAIPLAKRKETILVVEDDDDVRAHSTDSLRELGYHVLEAKEGDAALSLLATEPQIELLFTDVGLPGPFNGRQLADEARKRRPDLKVLFTTGYARNAIVHHGRLDPGVNLIVKPFTFAALAARVRLVLDGK